MNASWMKYDYGTFREGLMAIQSSITNVLDEELSKTEKEKIVEHVLYHLEMIRELVVESDYTKLVDRVMVDIKNTIK